MCFFSFEVIKIENINNNDGVFFNNNYIAGAVQYANRMTSLFILYSPFSTIYFGTLIFKDLMMFR